MFYSSISGVVSGLSSSRTDPFSVLSILERFYSSKSGPVSVLFVQKRWEENTQSLLRPDMSS